MILPIFLLQTVFLSSCTKKDSTAPRIQEEVRVDYFAGKSSLKINKARYTIIDDYVKWIPILYYDKDFDAIEENVSALLKEKNEAKSYELYAFYLGLAKITHVKYIDLMQNVLDEWCNERPGSHIPWLVRGIFYTNYAWHIRGGGWAKDVAKDAWQGFHAKLELAQKDLQKSWELNPKDPNSSCHLIVVTFGLSYPREEMEQHYQNAISACPWHFGARIMKLQYLMPKWHGSARDMFDFARQCLKSSEKFPNLGLITIRALEEAQKNINPKGENTLGRGEDWATIEKIYAHFFAKYPEEIRGRFYFAHTAHVAEKWDVALKQFKIIGDRWMEGARWHTLKRYNETRAYVYSKKGADLVWNRKLYGPAIDYFRLSAECDPHPDTLFRLGVAYMYSGIYERNEFLLLKGEETLKKVIELKPNRKIRKAAKTELKKLRKYLRK